MGFCDCWIAILNRSIFIISDIKNYKKKGIQPMRPYIHGEDLTGVSVSVEDTPEIGMFCPNNCKYLNITEEQQDVSNKKDIPHVCQKVNKRLIHGIYHPKLIQLEECKKEILFRKFYS